MEIFSALVPIVDELRFTRPSCMVENNSKAVVIAFSDMATPCKFLSTLSAIATKELCDKYLRKELRGRKSGSWVEAIVSEEKQFSFTYKTKKGQMNIFFYFGEWNIYGFPQHN